MAHDFSRREFLASAVVGAAGLGIMSGDPGAATAGDDRAESLHEALPDAASLGTRGSQFTACEPFDLHSVRLLPGFQATAMGVNRRYMLAIAPDRLLHNFRVNAGLPSSATPIYGWEAPENELRGHFVGHYLSACALMGAQAGDDEVKARGTLIVGELAKCQAALGGGYLSAFPKEFFDRLKARQRVWAPFYTYHKILQGMIDTHALSGSAQALDVAKGMANWVKEYAAPIPDELWQRMLTTEYGGMNDSLRELAQVSGDASFVELAKRFDHELIFAPLAVGRDELKGVHGNTNVPKILGAARAYEMTGNERMRAIADFFWEDVTSRRSYATGGCTNDEEWQGEPGQLAKALGPMTQETCVSYNMLKLTRHKFTWSPEARYADFYERAYYNGILGTQHPADGEKLYYTPLKDGYWKLFGVPDYGFWCCHGSGVENFSKLGDSIYFHDDDGIWVNLFVASEVNWTAKGMRLRQETTFPSSDVTTLSVTVDKPVQAAIRVRVPYWVAKGGHAKLNGRTLDAFAGPGSYLVVDRTWKTGDVLEVTLPMYLHTHPMPDDRGLQAIMYGPLVLVGRMGTSGMTEANRRAEKTAPRTVPEPKNVTPIDAPAISAPSDDPASWLKPVAGRPLEFRTIGQATAMTFAPLYTVFDERYATYFRVNRT